MRAGRARFHATRGAGFAAVQGDRRLEGRDAAGERVERRLVERVHDPELAVSRRRWRSPTRPSRPTRPTTGRRSPSSTRRAPALFPTVNGTGRRRASEARHDVDRRGVGTWTLDVWGEVRREIEAQTAGAEASAATLANATLAAQSALALAYIQVRQADSLEDLLTRTVEEYKRSLTITQNQYNAGTAAKSDVITAQAQVLNAQAQLVAAGVTRAQSEHAIAVLMGRPPAGLTISRGSLATRVPSIPVSLPSRCLSAGPTSQRPRRRCGRPTPRSASPSPAISRRSRCPAWLAIPAIPSARAPSARPIRSGRSEPRSLSRFSTAG